MKHKVIATVPSAWSKNGHPLPYQRSFQCLVRKHKNE